MGGATPPSAKKKKKKTKLRADMIRRVDVPVRVNQMNVGGHLREGEGEGEGASEGRDTGDNTAEGSPLGVFTNGALTDEPEVQVDGDPDDEDMVDRSEPSFPVTAPRHSPGLADRGKQLGEGENSDESDDEDDDEDMVDRSEPSFPITKPQPHLQHLVDPPIKQDSAPPGLGRGSVPIRSHLVCLSHLTCHLCQQDSD